METPGASFGEPGGDSVSIETFNDFLLATGENLPNHSMSMRGLGRFVSQGVSTIPQFRTRQDAYRYAAWLTELAEILPDKVGQEGVAFEQVRDAIRNT